MTAETIQPRVYVACLAAYNNGMLHGKWIDADDGVDALWEGIRDVLKTSPIPGAEEWAIHDHEYLGGSISEYESIETVARLGEAVAEHGEAFLAFLSASDSTEEATVEEFQERYRGHFDSERDYAYHQVEELGLAGISPGKYVLKGDWEGRSEVDVLEALSGYIDWDTVAREAFMDHTMVDGHVFDHSY